MVIMSLFYHPQVVQTCMTLFLLSYIKDMRNVVAYFFIFGLVTKTSFKIKKNERRQKVIKLWNEMTVNAELKIMPQQSLKQSSELLYFQLFHPE